MSLIKGKTGEWEAVIGLEVHAQVIAESKLFSGAATAFGAEPNTQVSLIDAALPGMLPVVNEKSLEKAVKTGLGLNAKINLNSVFERKNYFYPDLPPGYQISQYLEPIVGEGSVTLDLADDTTKVVGIERLHLEQDAGKSLHDQHPSDTYIDLNRAGVTLMEIVTKPDLRSAEEAGAFLEKLRAILRYLGTCDGNMEQGSLRCDVNVSVRRLGEKLGTRTETKNVNSIRFVRQTIEHEAKRQVALIEDGGKVTQETRLFDPDKGTTRTMRTKEEAHDYRYFPDPDLLPVVLDPDWVEDLRRNLPELPDAKKARFVEDYGFSTDVASKLVVNKDVADWFEQTEKSRLHKIRSERKNKGITYAAAEPFVSTATQGILEISPEDGITFDEISTTATTSTTLILGPVFRYLNENGIDISGCPISPSHLAGLAELIDSGTISGRIAKEVFDAMWESGKDAAVIVEEKGLKQISDSGAIEALVDKAIADNPKQVGEFKAGNEKVLGWLVGQVMKASQGKANPGAVNQLLRKKLG